MRLLPTARDADSSLYIERRDAGVSQLVAVKWKAYSALTAGDKVLVPAS